MSNICFPMTTSTQLRSFPPVNDVIDYIDSINWENVRYRTLRALSLVGIVLAFIGATLTSFGQWLQECDSTYDTSGMPEVEPPVTELEERIERIKEMSSPAAKAVAADFEPDAHFTDMADIKEQLAGLSAYKPPMGFK